MADNAAHIEAFKKACLESALAHPKCPEGCQNLPLQHHEWCRRRLIIRADEELCPVEIEILRWKCQCGKSFRNLPKGVLPYTRYVLAAMVPCLLALLQGKSYVEASVEVEHPSTAPEDEEGRNPAPSTVYRWVGSLARFSRHICDRLSGVLAQQERATVIPLPRCRSESRKDILGLCLRVLLALGKIPPDFATHCQG